MSYAAHSDIVHCVSDYAADGFLAAEVCYLHGVGAQRMAAVRQVHSDCGAQSGDQLLRIEAVCGSLGLVPDAEQDGHHRRHRHRKLLGTKVLYISNKQ